jgi:hypothetical protein
MSTENIKTETDSSPKPPAVAVGSLARGSAFGQLTRAGTFPIRDEETTGFVVSCSREQIAALPRLPMYRDVVIVERTELVAADKITERIRSLLQQMLDVAENADETGYVTDMGFVDLDKLHSEVREALSPNGADQPRRSPVDTQQDGRA